MWFNNWFKKLNKTRPAATGRLRILVLSTSIGERLTLEQIGKQHRWELCFIQSPREGINLASKGQFELILCDRDQPGYPWREVMERLAANSPRSSILLLSPVKDDYLWQEVVQRGGYGVLLRPLHEKAVLRSIDAAVHFVSPEAQFCSH